MTSSAEEKLAPRAGAALDALLSDVERQIVAIALPAIPYPGSGPLHPRRADTALQELCGQIDRLCTQREFNAREAQDSMALAERSIRSNDDAAAKEALVKHAEHLRLFHDADAQLSEFSALITEVQRVLSMREGAV